MAARVAATRAQTLWLFDIDGTLVAQSPDQLEAWIVAVREVCDVRLTAGEVAPHLGQTFEAVLQSLADAHGQTVPPGGVSRGLAAYISHVRGCLARRPVRPLPAAIGVLTFLRTQGALVGVVTGNFVAEGEPKLTQAGLRNLLDVVTYADLRTAAREDLVRRAVTAAQRQGFHGGFADTVVVGDSIHDIQSGQRTGAMVVAVATGPTSVDRLAAVGPDLLLPDLTALLDRLQAGTIPWLPAGHPVS
jgi:phosphoglycolate phosphatase-like HAD superfamily hydrolase